MTQCRQYLQTLRPMGPCSIICMLGSLGLDLYIRVSGLQAVGWSVGLSLGASYNQFCGGVWKGREIMADQEEHLP